VPRTALERLFHLLTDVIGFLHGFSACRLTDEAQLSGHQQRRPATAEMIRPGRAKCRRGRRCEPVTPRRGGISP
jgi:hypothetical protein